ASLGSPRQNRPRYEQAGSVDRQPLLAREPRWHDQHTEVTHRADLGVRTDQALRYSEVAPLTLANERESVGDGTHVPHRHEGTPRLLGHDANVTPSSLGMQSVVPRT